MLKITESPLFKHTNIEKFPQKEKKDITHPPNLPHFATTKKHNKKNLRNFPKSKIDSADNFDIEKTQKNTHDAIPRR